MDIKVDYFDGYKVDKNPKTARIVDNSINKTYWESDGWSTMYDVEVDDMKNKWKNLKDSDIKYMGDSLEFPTPTSRSKKLDGIFDFITKKDGYEHPAKAGEHAEILFKPNTLYPGTIGFAVVIGKGDDSYLTFIPYPTSTKGNEELGEIQNFITGIKDNGVFIWDTNLENRYEDDYVI
jgi:hypothetical protein